MHSELRTPAAAPIALPIEQGATAVPDRATFETLARRDDVPGALGAREMKFLMIGVDGPAPELYFLNTVTHPFHYDFASEALDIGLDAGAVQRPHLLPRRPHRTSRARSSPTTASRRPAAARPASTRSSSGRPIPSATRHVALAYDAIRAAMPFAAPQLAYHPAGDTQEALFESDGPRAARRSACGRSRPPSCSPTSPTSPLNLGEGFGVLSTFDPSGSRPPTSRDVVLFTQLPNDLGHVAGVISEHAADAALPRQPQGAPERHPERVHQGRLDRPADRAAHGPGRPLRGGARRLHGRGRHARAGRGVARARPPAASADAAARPQPHRDHRPRRAGPRRRGDRRRQGGQRRRAAQDAAGRDGPRRLRHPVLLLRPLHARQRLLRRRRGDRRRPGRAGRPRAARRAPRRAAPQDPPRRARRPSWPSRSTRCTTRFDPGTTIRCRSSTNNEDLKGFNGAGLYDSHTHRDDEGDLSETVKQVWASLWTFRGVDEREFHRIDHLAAAMAVLVHPNFDDELANGVAVTKNPFDPNLPGLLRQRPGRREPDHEPRSLRRPGRAADLGDRPERRVRDAVHPPLEPGRRRRGAS